MSKKLETQLDLIRELREKGENYAEILSTLEGKGVKSTKPGLSVFCKKHKIKKYDKNKYPKKPSRMIASLDEHFDLIKKSRESGETYASIKTMLEEIGLKTSNISVNTYCRSKGFEIKCQEGQKGSAICFLQGQDDLQRFQYLKGKISFPDFFRFWFKVTANQIRKTKGLELAEKFELPRFTTLQLKTFFPEKKEATSKSSKKLNPVRIAVSFEGSALQDLALIRKYYNSNTCIKEGMEYAEALLNLGFSKHISFPVENN